MKKLTLLILALWISLSAEVDISGVITNNTGSPQANVIVRLENTDYVDTTGTDGKYRLFKAPVNIISSAVSQSASLFSLVGSNITFNLSGSENVSAQLFTLQGRQVAHRTFNPGVGTSHFSLNSLFGVNTAAGIYIAEIAVGDKKQVLRLCNSGNGTLSGVGLLNSDASSSSSPVQTRSVTETTGTLIVEKDGQIVTKKKLITLQIEIPIIEISQKMISGSFSSAPMFPIQRVVCVLTGDDISGEYERELWFSTQNNPESKFSGYFFVTETDEVVLRNAHIEVYNSEGKVCGRSVQVTFNSNAGIVDIPGFVADNAVPKIAIRAPQIVSINDEFLLEAQFVDMLGDEVAKTEWKIGDGEWTEETGLTKTVTASSTAGTIIFGLRMTDSEGIVCTVEHEVSVLVDAPVAKITGAGTGVINQGATISRQESTPGQFGTITSARWSIGSYDSFVESDAIDTVITLPSTAGDYPIVLEITDDDNNVTLDTLNITVIISKAIDFISAPGITTAQLTDIIADPTFYDPNHFVLDTCGIHGGDYSGGMIDTWYDQVNNESIWQIQIGVSDDSFRSSIGYICRYNPTLMSNGEYANGGPHYIMSLAMVQEYFSIDMQVLAATAPIETNAGIEISETAPNQPVVFNGVSRYISNCDKARGMGPWHIEGTGFQEKCLRSFPKFYINQYNVDVMTYMTTPGFTNKQISNSPQIVNSAFAYAMYQWKFRYQVFEATDFDKELMFVSSRDKLFSMKTQLMAWQEGFGSHTLRNALYSESFYNNTHEENIGNMASHYVKKVDPFLQHIVSAARTTTVNGGTSEVVDQPISLAHIEEFFFGTSGNGTAGTLGTGGLLMHSELDQPARVALWTDISEAFEILEGQAPSTEVGQISFRYDWLAILRIAKSHLDLSIPVPTDLLFTDWVNKHSTK